MKKYKLEIFGCMSIFISMAGIVSSEEEPARLIIFGILFVCNLVMLTGYVATKNKEKK